MVNENARLQEIERRLKWATLRSKFAGLAQAFRNISAIHRRESPEWILSGSSPQQLRQFQQVVENAASALKDEKARGYCANFPDRIFESSDPLVVWLGAVRFMNTGYTIVRDEPSIIGRMLNVVSRSKVLCDALENTPIKLRSIAHNEHSAKTAKKARPEKPKFGTAQELDEENPFGKPYENLKAKVQKTKAELLDIILDERKPTAQKKPGPKNGSRKNTIKRQAAIKMLAKDKIKDLQACMQLTVQKIPLQSKRLQDIYQGDWRKWFHADTPAFRKQWSRDLKAKS